MSRSFCSRLAGVGLSVVGIGFAVTATIALVQRWHQPSYAMPLGVVILAGACTGLTVLGAVISLRRGDVVRAWLTLLTTLLFLWAFLLMFSIGTLLLIIAVISLVARVRLADQSQAARWRTRVGAGLALSLGLAPLSELAIERPVVECNANGVTEAAPIWTWFASGSASVSGGGSGSSLSSVSTGSVSIGSTTYHYICAGDSLRAFTSR